MPTAKDRYQLVEEFRSGRMTADKYWERLKKLPAPWQTSEWQVRRAHVLASCCATCGAAGDGTVLVLQHTWHPSSFLNLCERVKPALRARYQIENPFVAPDIPRFDPSLVPFETEERKCCPKCGSPVVVFLKKDLIWKCNGKCGKTRYGYPIQCGHRFAEPVCKQWSRWTHAEQIELARGRHNAPKAAAEFAWERSFFERFRSEIMNQATMLSIDEHERYMEMRTEDTKTLCKCCAFKEDAKAGKIEGRF